MYGIPVHVQFGHFRNHGVVPVSFFNFILLITYMETPYGGPMVRRWEPGRIQVRVS